MATQPPKKTEYVLGNEPTELARLDRQAAWLEPPTRLLLAQAGIRPGMRVLDVGTGLGHVARLVGELVGPTGTVIGIDRSSQAISVARQRTEVAGASRVSFIEGDVSVWRSPEPFDAIVGRLVLFHLPDRVRAVRQLLENLRPGGLFVALDFDAGVVRSEPPVPIVAEVGDWIERAFATAGAWPRVGARLGPILGQAGLAGVKTVGIQGYAQPGDPFAPAFLSGLVRSLSDSIMRHGIATAEQIGADSLEQRIGDALRDADAVLLPPTLVGAWGRRPPQA
jgi:ubiquinone/menaquinone biosynthesis C-methylase UbiE